MEAVIIQNGLKDVANLADLETAVQNAVKQIRQCDEQIALWQNKKQSLQKEVNAKLAGLQQQVSEVVPNDAVKTVEPKTLKVEKNSTIPEMIHSFLEKNGPARAKDIRKFLLSNGRKTNPGVALSRMVKTGGLTNAERGLYKIK
jgi:hypothetical protein